MIMFARKFLLLLFFISLITLMEADHSSSDSSDNKDHHKDHHSEDVHGKDKEKDEKGKINEEYYDEEANLSDKDIDKMFGDQQSATTQKTSENGPAVTKPTDSPPLGAFGPEYWNSLIDKQTTPPKVVTTETPNVNTNGKDNGGNSDGLIGNPFFPYPRPVDIWDRLLVIAAFPICFFAVMLKGVMFR